MSERDDILGTTLSHEYDLRVGATWHEINTILKIIRNFDIKNFVEVGVHEGGLTEYLINFSNCEYLGIEINPSIPSSKIIERLATSKLGDILFEDCFSPTALSSVGDFISGSLGACLVYCDGGNKKEEIQAYSKKLRSNDVLLTHDFHDGVRKVRDLLEYSTWEVGLEDIEFIENDSTFIRLPEDLLKETRLIGWMKQ